LKACEKSCAANTVYYHSSHRNCRGWNAQRLDAALKATFYGRTAERWKGLPYVALEEGLEARISMKILEIGVHLQPDVIAPSFLDRQLELL